MEDGARHEVLIVPYGWFGLLYCLILACWKGRYSWRTEEGIPSALDCFMHDVYNELALGFQGHRKEKHAWHIATSLER